LAAFSALARYPCCKYLKKLSFIVDYIDGDYRFNLLNWNTDELMIKLFENNPYLSSFRLEGAIFNDSEINVFSDNVLKIIAENGYIKHINTIVTESDDCSLASLFSLLVKTCPKLKEFSVEVFSYFKCESSGESSVSLHEYTKEHLPFSTLVEMLPNPISSLSINGFYSDTQIPSDIFYCIADHCAHTIHTLSLCDVDIQTIIYFLTKVNESNLVELTIELKMMQMNQ
jgi:hypothetical protein